MYSYDFNAGFRVFKDGLLLPKLDYVDDPIIGNQDSINNALFWYKSHYDEESRNISYERYVSALTVCDSAGIPTGNLRNVKISQNDDTNSWDYSLQGRNGSINSNGFGWIGHVILASEANYPHSAYFTFRNLNIPAGATIKKAYIKLFSPGGYENDNCSMLISAHKLANSTSNPSGDAFTPPEDRDIPEYDFNRTNWEITDNTVDWTNIPHWVNAAYYVTPDLSCIVQEVIDLPGWAEANPIKFFIESVSDPITSNGAGGVYTQRGYYDYYSSNSIFGNDSKAPELVIWYTLDTPCEDDGTETGAYNSVEVISEEDCFSYAVAGTASDLAGPATILQNNHVSYNQVYFGGFKAPLISPSYIDESVGVFFTFKNIQIPQGTVINKARLVLSAHHAADDAMHEDEGWTGDQNWETVIAKITAHNVGDSPSYPNFDSIPNDTIAWPRTDSEVQWNGFSTWVEGELYYSPNIACLIQEIVNRPDWEPGNSIKIFIDNNYSIPSTATIDGKLVAIRSFANYSVPSTQWPYPPSSPPTLEFWFGTGTSNQSDLILGGGATTNMIVPTGDLILGGGEYSLVNDYEFDLDVYWNLKANLDIQKTFYWNIGNIPLRWYRVEGCCAFVNPDGGYLNGTHYQGGCDITGISVDDPVCMGSRMQFIQNILAASVADVCNQLAAEKMKWQVCSIKRWSRPVDRREFTSADDECNVLSEVPYCEIPECIRYCLNNEFIIEIDAETYVIDNIQTYVGGGTVYTSGQSESIQTGATESSMVEYTGGGTVYISGEAQTQTSWESLLLTETVSEAFVDDYEVSLSSEEIQSKLTIQTSTVSTSCGCSSMPLIIYMHHNLVQEGILLDFLQRNGFSVSDPLIMHYNPKLNSWNSNYHLTGADNESWRFTFEWACVNEVNEEETNPFWKFSCLITRSLNNEEFDTRILITFPKSICESIENLDFDFIFNLNVINDYVSNNIGVSNDSLIKYDNIGLFKTKPWVKNQKLTIKLSKSVVQQNVDRQDISSIFPQNTNLGQNNNIVVR